jgi:hypothetical protein
VTWEHWEFGYATLVEFNSSAKTHNTHKINELNFSKHAASVRNRIEGVHYRTGWGLFVLKDIFATFTFIRIAITNLYG